MARASYARVAETIAEMFLRFPASANAPDASARIAAYASDLQRFPIWAVHEGVAKAAGSFAPSSADLRESVTNIVRPLLAEQTKIYQLLRAEVYHDPDEAERARVAVRITAVSQKLGLRKSEAAREEAKIAAEAWLTEYRVSNPPLPILSAAARKTLGLPDHADRDFSADTFGSGVGR